MEEKKREQPRRWKGLHVGAEGGGARHVSEQGEEQSVRRRGSEDERQQGQDQARPHTGHLKHWVVGPKKTGCH